MLEPEFGHDAIMLLVEAFFLEELAFKQGAVAELLHQQGAFHDAFRSQLHHDLIEVLLLGGLPL